MLPCLNKQLFGIDCPGCGLQRSVLLLFKGEFVAAFQMYPAIYTLFLLLIFLGSNLIFKFKNAFPIKVGLLIANVVIIVISYILKMNNLLN
ncbi:DUF2752 domain-containing protein [Croceitalea sp. MTPC6]